MGHPHQAGRPPSFRYITGLLPARAAEHLPRRGQPVGQYLMQTQSPTNGACWPCCIAEHPRPGRHRHLSGCSVVCLLALIPMYIAQDRHSPLCLIGRRWCWSRLQECWREAPAMSDALSYLVKAAPMR
jgi:hypothetical protein